MLSLPFGFRSNIRRSGHAACWCPPLDGIVQFGGWPPSEELSRTIEQDGMNCPLYLLPAKEIVKGVERAKREHANPSSPTRVVADTADADADTARRASQRVNWLEKDADMVNAARGNSGRPRRKVWLLAIAKDLEREKVEGKPAEEDDEGEDSVVASVRYDEGYQSEPSDLSGVYDWEGGGEEEAGHGSRSNSSSSSSPSSSSSSDARGGVPADSSTAVVAPVVTAELLRALGSNMMSEAALPHVGDGASSAGHLRGDSPSSPSPPMSFHGAASTNTATTISTLPAVFLASRRARGVGEQFREAPPITADIVPIPGKLNTPPLRWRTIREFIAPRTRHGHHLVYHDNHLYVIGGSYWAHGNALATTDMSYNLRTKSWHQLNSLFPPRFCAALAESNTAVPVVAGGGDEGSDGGELARGKVLYAFGGLDYTQQLTATLHRLWLPDGALQELPQYGASPRKQFKGLLVCDVEQELSVQQLREGQRSLGRLFYMDGFQDGRPTAPALRYYSLATGFWVKVCSCPDLVRGQIAGTWRSSLLPPPNDGKPAATTAAHSSEGVPHLTRFDVFGGMPSRRGKQRRSRVCYSFDAERRCFDYANPLPVPGLTAHCIAPLPQPTTSDASRACGGSPTSESAWLCRLRDTHGISAISCGGNEDLNGYEQNSLGEPVSWVYLLGQREIPLSEQVRAYIDTRKIPYKIMLAPHKDELLDELF